MTSTHEGEEPVIVDHETTQDTRTVRTYPLRGLSGHHPAHVLACWGLTSLLPGARLSFTGDAAVPVLHWDIDAEKMTRLLAETLTQQTWGLDEGVLAGVQTTTPTRTQVNTVISHSWTRVEKEGDLPVASLEAIWDVSTSDLPIKTADIKIHASDLTMLSGRSYTSNSLKEAWELLGATSLVQARECARREAAMLLEGRISVAEAKPGLRFSASHPTPRSISGSERCDVEPFVDLLAFCGQLLLAPLQRERDAEGRRRKVLTWFLNPVPLTIEALTDLHESPPVHLPWPLWCAPITQSGSTAKISFLGEASEVSSMQSKERANV